MDEPVPSAPLSTTAMTVSDDPAERRLFQDFLLGRLPDADAERVAERIAADPRGGPRSGSGRNRPSPPGGARPGACRIPSRSAGVVRADRSSGEVAPKGYTTAFPASNDTADHLGPATTPATLTFLRPAQADDELGRLAGFRILEVLGKGGMGLVFRAEDVQLRREIALKVIKPEHIENPQYRERFLREARAAAALQHDHVMPVHQIGEDNGVLFLAMPLLKGETLEARLARGTPLSLAEQLRIGREIALGLAAAHASGLIHRDIKPSNVWLEARSHKRLACEAPQSTSEPLVTTDDRVKILDFGLVLPVACTDPLTQTGKLLGTPAYMSPEQADGGRVDARSDLFSLGCVLYRMATGKQPFARDTLTATLRAVADHTPAPPLDIAPDVPPPLSELIVRLLAKSPADRPASAAVTADALRSIELGDVPTTDYRPLTRMKIRRRTLAAALPDGRAARHGGPGRAGDVGPAHSRPRIPWHDTDRRD